MNLEFHFGVTTFVERDECCHYIGINKNGMKISNIDNHEEFNLSWEEVIEALVKWNKNQEVKES